MTVNTGLTFWSWDAAGNRDPTFPSWMVVFRLRAQEGLKEEKPEGDTCGAEPRLESQ